MIKKLKVKNIIQIIGSIDEEAFKSFSEELTAYEKAGAKEVTIELSSAGGHAYDALAFYSRIRLSSCDVQIIVYGLVASAAVLVLAAGDRRYMTSEAWVMVHEDSVHKMSAKVTEIEKFGRHMRVQEDQWNKLLEFSTKLSASGWSQLHKAETYMTAKDCLKHGLIEEII